MLTIRTISVRSVAIAAGLLACAATPALAADGGDAATTTAHPAISMRAVQHAVQADARDEIGPRAKVTKLRCAAPEYADDATDGDDAADASAAAYDDGTAAADDGDDAGTDDPALVATIACRTDVTATPPHRRAVKLKAAFEVTAWDDGSLEADVIKVTRVGGHAKPAPRPADGVDGTTGGGDDDGTGAPAPAPGGDAPTAPAPGGDAPTALAPGGDDRLAPPPQAPAPGRLPADGATGAPARPGGGTTSSGATTSGTGPTSGAAGGDRFTPGDPGSRGGETPRPVQGGGRR